MKMKMKKFEELSNVIPMLAYQRIVDENILVVFFQKFLSFTVLLGQKKS
jgi:hypothetical protein